MDLEELEKTHTEPPPRGSDEGPQWVSDDIDPEDQAIIDIKEAIILFATVKTLLDYIGNQDLIKRVSQRERETIYRVSEQVRKFLAEVEPTYIEEDE